MNLNFLVKTVTVLFSEPYIFVKTFFYFVSHLLRKHFLCVMISYTSIVLPSTGLKSHSASVLVLSFSRPLYRKSHGATCHRMSSLTVKVKGGEKRKALNYRKEALH